MKYVVKSLIIVCIIFNLFLKAQVSAVELILLFGLISATVFTDAKSSWAKALALAAECVILYLVGSTSDYLFLALLVLVFDLIYTKLYYFAAAAAGLFIYFGLYSIKAEYWLIIALAGIISYVLRNDEDSKAKHHAILDNERRTKYELELAQAMLIKSQREAEKLAEEKERNRIARDVHDNVGHSIAGILIKLQATKKVLLKDSKAGIVMLDECVGHLQKSLQILRDTVHNMYKSDKKGVGHIENIVSEFKYCGANIKTEGNFENCSERIFQCLSYVLKEALTNTARHSHATSVHVILSSLDDSVVLTVADNGQGCREIKESLGMRSMRDRTQGLKGELKIDGTDGMRIVCAIPYEGENT